MATLITVEHQATNAINFKPTLIGLYGLSGAGKSHLINQLRAKLDPRRFRFFEGAEAIVKLVPGWFEECKTLSPERKTGIRTEAIQWIERQCLDSGKCGIVAGHAMFWDNVDAPEGDIVCTEADMAAYSHVLYLEVPPETIVERRKNDAARGRVALTVDHISKWQQAERDYLQCECWKHGIAFSTITSQAMTNISRLFEFCDTSKERNSTQARGALKKNIDATWRSIIIFDADKTLAPTDAGRLFWKHLWPNKPIILDELFRSSLSYQFKAFQNATLLYEMLSDDVFEATCDKVAAEIALYPEIDDLLSEVERAADTGAVVVTCGVSSIWQKVLARQGLSVKVVGGGPVSDGYVISPDDKRDLVSQLQIQYKMSVCAFGDSPLDLPMLKQADHAVVVVGNADSRSYSMEGKLRHEISVNGFLARQALLPDSATARLDTDVLPITKLDEELLSSLTERSFGTHLPTSANAVKMLATPMRDASFAGSALREAHRRTGWYLATELVSDVVGVDRFPIINAQGKADVGNRLLNEEQTIVIPLMRGGEPMAFGVSDAFPLARFVHARLPSDLTSAHLKGCKTVILVDSVVNSGKGIIEFARYIRLRLHCHARIIVVAGVVQAQAAGDSGELARALTGYGQVDLVALRVSDNKYKGVGGTDTGHRLFNTTYLD